MGVTEMTLGLNQKHQDFAAEIRRFLAEDYPQDLIAKWRVGSIISREDHVRSQRALQSRGWLATSWPKEHGGPGWNAVERYIFNREMEYARVPEITPMALIYIGPIIAAFGTAEQQERWLPDILQSRTMWAQGYSEPEAGSDLASLSMRARRDGDDYILDGSKIWTTRAQWADWIFCLVRTSSEERKQHGISMICVPMDAPGITIRPIISIDGSYELNQVIFENVRTAATNRIGEEGQGWHYANVLLGNERLSYAHIGRKCADLEEIRLLANRSMGMDVTPKISDPVFANRLARLEIRLANLEMAVIRALAGDASPAAISALKIQSTELAQDIAALWMDVGGRYSLVRPDRETPDWEAPFPPDWQFAAPRGCAYLFDRAQTIYGGATEIQKNIIWRALNRTVGRE
ncbi:MAG: acyl-CoA dehydrogenase family protein [Sphingomonadaceae bacterium]